VSAVTNNVSTIAALQSAINSAASGDIIILADGTYLNSTITIPSGKNGITVKSATPGGVYLNGTQAVVIDGNGNTFSGFQFTSGNVGSGIPIIVNGSQNLLTQLNINGYIAQKYINLKSTGRSNVVAYCNFENKPTSAPIGNLIHIALASGVPGYHKIRYNSFQNMPGAGGDNGNECIRLENGAQSTYVGRNVVEFNYFENTGLGDSEVISVKCRENVLRYNTMVNNNLGNFCFRNGNYNIAYGNFFINSGGIRVKEANDIYCYNNYFENCGDGTTTAPIKYVYVSPNLKNINFIHNTIIGGSLIELGSGATGNTWANNIFKKTSGNIFSGSPSGITWAGNQYTGTLGISIPSGMTSVANPYLVLNSDGYYGLSSSSPAIDASSSSYPAILDITNVDDDPTLTMDISGQTRPASAILKDVGCDEYGVNATLNRPLLLSEVGPSYLGGPGGDANNAPVFTVDPISKAAATADVAYTGQTLSGSATDADGDTLTYSKLTGPTWLSVATSGALTGTPASTNVGANSWTVQVSDGNGGTDTAVLNITVNAAPASSPTFVAAGAIAGGTGTIAPALPTGRATGDILLLFVETANQACSISNPNGGTWAEITPAQGTGTAAGTAATRLTAFWSRYNGTQGAPTVSDSGNHTIGRMIAIRGAVASGNPWDVTAGGVEATADTSGSIPGATTTVADTLVVTAVAASLPDATSTAIFSGWANANLTSLTERTDNANKSNNGGALGVATGVKAVAGAYGNTTVTHSSAAVKGMMSIAIKK